MSEPQKAAAPTGALDRYFKISERGSSIAAEFRGGLAAFFAMSYIVVLNPLVIGTGADASERTLGIAPVAAVTALVAGVMTILMGVIAKQPFAMAAGLGEPDLGRHHGPGRSRRSDHDHSGAHRLPHRGV